MNQRQSSKNESTPAKAKEFPLLQVGFEPTPPKRLRPERNALDHSATAAYSAKQQILQTWSKNIDYHSFQKRRFHDGTVIKLNNPDF